MMEDRDGLIRLLELLDLLLCELDVDGICEENHNECPPRAPMVARRRTNQIRDVLQLS